MFTSVHHWDEDSFGNWTLSIEDQGNGDTGTLFDWELNIYGTEINTDRDGDGLTNYDEVSIYGTDPMISIRMTTKLTTVMKSSLTVLIHYQLTLTGTT